MKLRAAVLLSSLACLSLLQCVGDDPSVSGGSGNDAGTISDDAARDDARAVADASEADAATDSDAGTDAGTDDAGGIGPRPPSTGEFLWKSVAPVGTQPSTALAFADDGALVVAFEFAAPKVKIGATEISLAAGSKANTNDIGVAVFDKAGTLRWMVAIGGTDLDFLKAVTTNARGDVFVALDFASPSITLDGQTFTRRATTGGFYFTDALLLKLDHADGRLVAGVDVGSTSTTRFASIRRHGRAMAFGVSHFDNVILPLAGSTQTFGQVASGNTANFIVGLWDPEAMSATWVRRFGDTLGFTLYDVVPDAVGGLAFVAGLRGSLRDAEGAMTFPQPAAFGANTTDFAAVGSIGPNASPRWAKVIAPNAASADTFAAGVAVDPNGDIVICGRTRGTVLIDALTTKATTGAATFVARLAKENGLATKIRTLSDKVGGYEFPAGIAIDPWGDVVVGVRTNGFTLDSVTISGTPSIGATLKLGGANFNALWGRSYLQGSVSTSMSLTTAVALDGRVATAGALYGTGPTDLGDGVPVPSVDGSMAIVVRSP